MTLPIGCRRRPRRKLCVAAVAPFIVATAASRAEAARGKCDAPIIVDQLCEAGKSVVGKAGEVIAVPARAATGGAVDMLTSWVADGAQWLLGRVVRFIDDSTSPDLTAEWFTERYEFMVDLGALVLLPMLLIAAVRAVMNQDMSQLLRSFFVYLPLAILGTFVAIFLTQTLLDVTDAMSASAAKGIGGDVSQIFDSVGAALGTTGALPHSVPSFAIFWGALFLIIGAFFVWLELLIRSAAVTASVFFLPLMLASLVWPTTSRWTRRLVETLIALILSKFVIVAVMSLAATALADPGGGGFGAVMSAAALMLMAAFSPMALLKLMPLVETAAMAHLEGSCSQTGSDDSTRRFCEPSGVDHALEARLTGILLATGRGRSLGCRTGRGRGCSWRGGGAVRRQGCKGTRSAHGQGDQSAFGVSNRIVFGRRKSWRRGEQEQRSDPADQARFDRRPQRWLTFLATDSVR